MTTGTPAVSNTLQSGRNGISTTSGTTGYNTQAAAQFNNALTAASPAPTSSGSSPYSGGSPYAMGNTGTGAVRPQFQLDLPSAPYQPASAQAEAQARASIPQPARPLPASQVSDGRASILGGRLDATVTPGDAPLTGLPRLMEQMTAPIGMVSNIAGSVLNTLGLQKPLAATIVSLVQNPITESLLNTGARLGGMAFGVAGQLLGDKTVSDITSNALNFISSEKGGATLASPALQSMRVNGEGWQGALDGVVHENAGLDWYSTFFLGNLKNRTGGGTGPEFYKQLVVDTWDPDPAGREFLASVGRSAVSRDHAARWYSEYYYDVLDQESGSGTATKVADTLDYRFGLDANNMNAIYKEGNQRAASFGRAQPVIAEDLHPSTSASGNPFSTSTTSSAAQPSHTGSYQTQTSGRGSSVPVSMGGLSTSNSALPTGPELSTSTSHTRAYQNNDAASSPLAGITNTIVGTAISALAGPLVSIAGGLLGKESIGNIVSHAVGDLFSDVGGNFGKSFLNGALMIPGGDNAVNSFLKGTLSSSAGTAWTITAMQQFSKSQDGLEWCRLFLEPLMTPRYNGKTILDELLEQAKNDPVLSNNLRAMADELMESGSAQHMMQATGFKEFITKVRQAIPVASRYAYLETSPNGHLPLSDPTRLKELFATNIGDQAVFNADNSLTDFGKVGLRMFGHDILDGKVDGDVVMRSLLNPSGSDNTDFRRNIEYVKKWGELDLADDNTMNGSVYRKLVEQCWTIVNGGGISPLQGLALTPSSTNEEVWRTDVPNMFDFKSFKVNLDSYQKLAQSYGLNVLELTDLVLWGHVVPKLPAKAEDQQAAFDTIIKDALEGKPTSTFENVFVRDVPGVREHFTQLLGNLKDFNNSAMNSMKKLISTQQARA